jgi:hypothetical protein
MATNSEGDVYVADASAEVVVEITPSGAESIVAGNGTQGAPIPGPATSSPFFSPEGLAVDSSGNLYIADGGNNVVEKVTPSGSLSVVAGNGTHGTAVAGPALSTPLDSPWGLAVDSSGDLYMGFVDQYQVAEVTPSGTLSLIAGNGTFGHPTAGAATSSRLGTIGGIAVDSSGNIYLADYYECVIEKVTPGGALSIAAGNGMCSQPAVSGPATQTPIGYLYGSLAADWQGDIYFADTGNSTVDEVTPSGTLLVVAGVMGTHGAPTPGPATSSDLSDPYGVAVDTNGNLYIDDTNNYRVERVSGVVVAKPKLSSGYWLAGSDGGVFAFGAPFYGSAAPFHPAEPIVGISSTPNGEGYWLAASDGGVFSFGNAQFYGSLPSTNPGVNDIVGITTDPDTGGYWLVGSNGGVFSYDAPFFGSLGTAIPTVSDIVGIAATTNGEGYYLVGSDGVVYPFGNAHSQGNASSVNGFHGGVVGIAVDQTTGGYWESAADGGVFAYGAPYDGSMGGTALNKAIVGISAVPAGAGYTIAGGDGGVFAYGTAFDGSMGGKKLNAPIVGAAMANQPVV